MSTRTTDPGTFTKTQAGSTASFDYQNPVAGHSPPLGKSKPAYLTAPAPEPPFNVQPDCQRAYRRARPKTKHPKIRYCQCGAGPLPRGKRKCQDCLSSARLCPEPGCHADLKGTSQRYCPAHPPLSARFAAEHGIWTQAKSRCRNPNHVEYPRYGGRGLGMCEHLETFEGFLHKIGPRPDRGLSLDRLNNAKGYLCAACNGGIPQIAWRTAQQQSVNRRTRSMTGYIGVSLKRHRSGRIKYRAKIQHQGRKIYVGEYKTPELAALGYDEMSRKLHGDLAVTNFGESA